MFNYATCIQAVLTNLSQRITISNSPVFSDPLIALTSKNKFVLLPVLSSLIDLFYSDKTSFKSKSYK